ncbi:MAG: response regulator transcription factor [Gemmatimonadaceae bacterium]
MNPAVAPPSPHPHHEPWVGIVDDDAPLRLAIARGLRANGICVQLFGSAEDFLARQADDAPACIVLDIRLCGLSGFDLQDALIARGDRTPIIFITSHDGMLAQTARARSTHGCLIKPFESDVLIALLRPHLRAATA